MPARPATLEYLAEIAKDWTLARFAAAQNSDFGLVAHRFELCGSHIRRYPLAIGSAEASSPLEVIQRVSKPTAWSHTTLVTLLVDSELETMDFEQEVVEILAVDDEDVIAQAAFVVRVPGCPPCLGPFWSAE